MAIAGRLQQRRTKPKGPVLQRVQIDATDDDVAAEQGGSHLRAAEAGGNRRQMFRSDQRDLACPAVAMITDHAGIRIEIGLIDRHQVLSPRRPDPDPGDLTRTHRRGEQFGQGRRRVQQDVISTKAIEQKESPMPNLVYVLNGPNLNLLGKRQPHIYGHETLADVERDCRTLAAELGLEIRFLQSNREYEIIDWIHQARETAGGIVINPAAFTHTSVAILDALNTFDAVVIEVHISNVHKREEFRHKSFVSMRADAVIAGCGTLGYQLALRRVAQLITQAAT